MQQTDGVEEALSVPSVDNHLLFMSERDEHSQGYSVYLLIFSQNTGSRLH